MNLFSRLFGATPGPEGDVDGASPRTAESAMSDQRPDQMTPETASLGFGEPLLRLAFEGGPAQRGAQQRLAELIDAQSIAIGQLPRDAGSRASVLAIAALTADPTNFATAAQAIVDPAE